MVLTHPHADHVNGLVEVLKRYKVGAVIMSGVSYNYSGYTAFLEEISSRRIPVLYAGAKIDGVPVDYRLGSVTLDMLFPFQSVQGRTFLNVHESMVVFRLLYGHESFLLTGDLEAPNEEKLIANGLDLHADFLKVGHHGSSTSSGGPFLDRVRPSFAAISCGIDNKFHHPYPATIDHLQQRSIKIFRTDLDGIIEAVSDGESLRMKAQGK